MDSGDTAKREAREWIEKVTEEPFHKDKTFAEELQSGVRLCQLIHRIDKGLMNLRSVHLNATPDGQPYKCMENISLFLAAAREIGVPETDLFPTIALFEKKDIPKVVIAVHSVGRYAQKNIASFTGPHLGKKVATTNKRVFTRDQKDAAYRSPALLNMGSAMTMARGAQGMQSSRLNVTDSRLNKDFGVGNTKVVSRKVVAERTAKTTQAYYNSKRDPKDVEFEMADENNPVPVTIRGSKWGKPSEKDRGKSERKVVTLAQKNTRGEHEFDEVDKLVNDTFGFDSDDEQEEYYETDEESLREEVVAASTRRPSKKQSQRRHTAASRRPSSQKHRQHSATSRRPSTKRANNSKRSNSSRSSSGGRPAATVPMPSSNPVDPDLENFVFVKVRDIDELLIEEAGNILEVTCRETPNYKFTLGGKPGKTVIKKLLKVGGGVAVVREKPDNVSVGVICWKPESAVLKHGFAPLAFLNVRKQEYVGAIRTIHKKNSEVTSGAWEVVACGVVPDYRNRGLGRKMLQHVTSMAEKSECGCVLDVTEESMKTWATKSGFKNFGRVNLQSHQYGSYLMVFNNDLPKEV